MEKLPRDIRRCLKDAASHTLQAHNFLFDAGQGCAISRKELQHHLTQSKNSVYDATFKAKKNGISPQRVETAYRRYERMCVKASFP